MKTAPLGWLQIVRLGLVQASLGALVVLTTSTMNRVMVVELEWPAIVPGALVALHYALQALRPRWGYGSDIGGRRTPWIVGGVAALALGCLGAALSIELMAAHRLAGLAAAVACFALIGAGVGAAGTSLLALLAAEVAPGRRAAAATIVWIMMILGFVVTTFSVGHLIEPYSASRLVAATAAVALAAVAISTLAVWGIERPRQAGETAAEAAAKPPFRQALAEVWAEPQARAFTLFVFAAMLAYSAEELILDPFSAATFGFSPGASTQLSGVLHGGVLIGMIAVGLAGSGLAGRRLRSLRLWSIGGCLGSALALAGLVATALAGNAAPLRASVFVLGVANGAFSIAAIGSMMALAGQGRAGRQGVKMGLWGAAQGLAFGLGGILSSGASDIARGLAASPGIAYAIVFAGEAALFLVAAAIALRVRAAPETSRTDPIRLATPTPVGANPW